MFTTNAAPSIAQCERIVSDLLQSLENEYHALRAIDATQPVGEYPRNVSLPLANKIDDVKALLADIRSQMEAA